MTQRGREPRTAAVRLGAVAAASAAAAWVHQNHDPGALSPRRRPTGGPCPFCGSPTVLLEARAARRSRPEEVGGRARGGAPPTRRRAGGLGEGPVQDRVQDAIRGTSGRPQPPHVPGPPYAPPGRPQQSAWGGRPPQNQVPYAGAQYG